MADSWHSYRIGEIGKVLTGRTPSGTHPDHFGEHTPFLTPTDMDGRRRVETTGRSLSQLGVEHLRQAIVPHGVAVSCIGWQMGKALLVDRPVITNQQINSIIPDETRVDDLFLYYALLGRRDEIFALGAGGSRTPILNKSGFENFTIDLPPLCDQRAIAHILGTLDDKIELNRRMNETLEAMARALFKSWFVDFDPIRAKAEGRDPGLPKAIADLFPDRFEDSELGEIPARWEAGHFGEVVEQFRDQENPLSSPDSLFSHYSIPAFDEGQRPKLEWGESIKSLKSRVPAGVILLSKLNPEIERVWMVDVQSGERAVCSTEFLVLCARTPFTKSYVYCLARSPGLQQRIEALVTGTSKSHQRAQADSILALDVIMPPAPILEVFEIVTSVLLDRTLACRRESRTLAALRDALLPKLISGELQVADSFRRAQGAPIC